VGQDRQGPQNNSGGKHLPERSAGRDRQQGQRLPVCSLREDGVSPPLLDAIDPYRPTRRELQNKENKNGGHCHATVHGSRQDIC